jgi:2-oxo-4-hydroxy-4-carboxy-5-ureidoimidazoline decarboxylase
VPRAGRRPTGPVPPGLERLNAAPRAVAEAALCACCGSRRWATRIAAHRPYPDLGALLAAAGEASYDMSQDDLAKALAAERAPQPPLRSAATASAAARTALCAARSAYKNRFGHVFLVCLTGHGPDEALDAVLASLHTRLGNDPDEERAVTAEELRGLALARLELMVTDPTADLTADLTAEPTADATGPTAGRTADLPAGPVTDLTARPPAPRPEEATALPR